MTPDPPFGILSLGSIFAIFVNMLPREEFFRLVRMRDKGII